MQTLQQSNTNSLQDFSKSIYIQIAGSSQFRRFQRMYARDRIAFVYDCMPGFAKTITDYQIEILGYYDEGYSRVAVRGPHGLGKTTLAAVLTHHSVLTSEEDCKVPTTASAWRQLEKYLWPEIVKTVNWIDWMEVGRPAYDRRHELLSLKLVLENQGKPVEAFALASDDYNTIEGAHATRMVYIFDEAKTIPRQTWNAAEGAFATAGLENVIPNSENEQFDIDELQRNYQGREEFPDYDNLATGRSSRTLPEGMVRTPIYNDDPIRESNNIVEKNTQNNLAGNRDSKDSRINLSTVSMHRLNNISKENNINASNASVQGTTTPSLHALPIPLSDSSEKDSDKIPADSHAFSHTEDSLAIYNEFTNKKNVSATERSSKIISANAGIPIYDASCTYALI